MGSSGSCSNAGPEKIRYGETDLPKMLTKARNMSPLKAKTTEAEKFKPLEPPFRPSTPVMMRRGEFAKSDTGRLPFTPKLLVEKGLSMSGSRYGGKDGIG
ncbi:hypothetical protein DL767_006543 [Monosporascus sp. MG133]|nr:hypothetical protein DL767_006543 [Monosporascus sp. MG133]